MTPNRHPFTLNAALAGKASNLRRLVRIERREPPTVYGPAPDVRQYAAVFDAAGNALARVDLPSFLEQSRAMAGSCVGAAYGLVTYRQSLPTLGSAQIAALRAAVFDAATHARLSGFAYGTAMAEDLRSPGPDILVSDETGPLLALPPLEPFAATPNQPENMP